jgi:hypothetical protein
MRGMRWILIGNKSHKPLRTPWRGSRIEPARLERTDQGAPSMFSSW